MPSSARCRGFPQPPASGSCAAVGGFSAYGCGVPLAGKIGAACIPNFPGLKVSPRAVRFCLWLLRGEANHPPPRPARWGEPEQRSERVLVSMAGTRDAELVTARETEHSGLCGDDNRGASASHHHGCHSPSHGTHFLKGDHDVSPHRTKRNPPGPPDHRHL